MCEHHKQVWCHVTLEDEEEEDANDSGLANVETAVSSVPSLALLATGLASSSSSTECPRTRSLQLWRRLKVRTAMEITATLNEWRTLRRHHESFQLLRRAVSTGVLLCTSRFALGGKVRAVVNLIERLRTDVVREYPDCRGLVSAKIRRLVDLPFYGCDPRLAPIKKPGAPSGVYVGGAGDDGPTYLCCLCPFDGCRGGCSTSFRPVPRVRVTSLQQKNNRQDHLPAANDGYQDEESANPFCYVDRDGGYNDDEEEESNAAVNPFDFIDSSSGDLCCSTYSYTEDEVIFSFVSSDFEAAHNFLASQSDSPGWTATSSTETEVRLERKGSGEAPMMVRAAFAKERRGFVRCVVSGDGLEQFSEEVVPNVVKLTSSKLKEEEGEGEEEEDKFAMLGSAHMHGEMNGGIYEDDDDDEDDHLDDDDDSYYGESDPTEMVFVEESSPSSAASTASRGGSWRGRRGGRGGGGLGLRRPRSKSAREFECRGCRAKFKYNTSYLKHESRCALAMVPPDVRAFPALVDGRKQCPGCGKAFAGINLFFLKHIRACPKVRYFCLRRSRKALESLVSCSSSCCCCCCCCCLPLLKFH